MKSSKMKTMKRIITVLILLGLISQAFCQVKNQGLAIGYNSSWFTGTGESCSEGVPIPGLSLGYHFDILISDILDLQTGIGLTTRGQRMSSIGDTYVRNIFVYLELPAYAKKEFCEGRKIRPFIIAGPSLNANILSINWTGFINDIRKFDICLNSGIGIKTRHFSIRARYVHGLFDFDISDYDNTLKNSTLTIEFGFNFGHSTMTSESN
jgi:hypothetical protein